MNLTRMVTAVVASAFATVGAVGVAGAHEVASQGDGPAPTYAIGQGLVRIDASWATIKTLADGSQVMTVAKKASGQWMGEVGPQQQLVVRDINVKRVTRAWNRLGHKRATGVSATLTWNSASDFAAISVSEPKVTPRGFLRFRLAPGVEAPDRMTDVTINLPRAAPVAARAFPVTSSYALSLTTSVVTRNASAFSASVSVNDSGFTCYTLPLSQPVPLLSLPNNSSCGTVTFTTGYFLMSLPSMTKNGTVLLNSNMLVSGTPFVFNAIVASWSSSGP